MTKFRVTLYLEKVSIWTPDISNLNGKAIHVSILKAVSKYCENDRERSSTDTFTIRCPGLYGFGTNAAFPGFPLFLFTVMDKVEVPAELSPGHYVLSFRWDCEQTPQIWTACANVNIACENCV